jgi:hypothetical protein
MRNSRLPAQECADRPKGDYGKREQNREENHRAVLEPAAELGFETVEKPIGPDI